MKRKAKKEAGMNMLVKIRVTPSGRFKLTEVFYWKRTGPKLLELKDAPAGVVKALAAKLA